MFGGRAAARRMGIAAPDQVADHKAAPARAERPDDDSTVQSLKRELALLPDALARNKRELSVLIGDGRERRMAHAAIADENGKLALVAGDSVVQQSELAL